MSSSNCHFLTCIQLSQDADKVVCISLRFFQKKKKKKNFHSFLWSTQSKALLSVVNKTEVDVFSGTLAFLMTQRMLAIWSLVPLAFLNPAWTSESSRFMYSWSLAWRILTITWLACEMSANFSSLNILWEKAMAPHSSTLAWKIPCTEEPGGLPSLGSHRVGHDWSDLAAAEHSLALSFFGILMKTDLFQSCDHCWLFQICWHIECSTFIASFRIWNNSTGIPSPPLALFVVMAHLTLNSLRNPAFHDSNIKSGKWNSCNIMVQYTVTDNDSNLWHLTI